LTLVADILDRITTDFEAATPPSRAGIGYHRLRTRAESGVAGDRSFYFRIVSKEPPSQSRTGVVTIDRIYEAVVRLSAAGRNIDELYLAADDETQPLENKIHARSSWPSGTRAVACLGTDYQPDEDSDDLLAIISLSLYGDEVTS